MNKLFILTIFFIFILNGCAIKSDFYGVYKDSNEIYEGYADFGATNGKISIWSKNTSEICNGSIKYNDGEVSFITGIYSGTSSLVCSSGNKLNGQWFIPSNWNYNAKGQFVDSNGKVMHFVFGENISGYKGQVFNSPTKHIRQAPQQHPQKKFNIPHKPYTISTGTGFFVSYEGHLVTNNHVIKKSSRIFIEKDSSRYEAKVIDIDRKNDLALLKIDYKSTPLYLFQGEDERKGESIASFGYPLVGLQGNELKTTFGNINSTTGMNGDSTYYQIDTPIQPGNSGGPLLNYYGEVIGVVTSTLNQQAALMTSGTFTQNVNYAVKVDNVIELLKDNDIPIIINNEKKRYIEVDLVRKNEKSVVLIIAH